MTVSPAYASQHAVRPAAGPAVTLISELNGTMAAGCCHTLARGRALRRPMDSERAGALRTERQRLPGQCSLASPLCPDCMQALGASGLLCSYDGYDTVN